MGSFAAVHVQSSDPDDLVDPIGEWLRGHGFGVAERMDAAPSSLRTFHLSTNTVGLGRASAAWSMLLFNGFGLGGGALDEAAIRPLAARVPARVVLFTGQTTSDAYQLVVLDGAACARRVMLAGGQCLANDGQPLPGERAGAFSMHEQDDDADDPPSVMHDAQAIAAAMGFELWPRTPLPGVVHVWRRRGLISRLFGK